MAPRQLALRRGVTLPYVEYEAEAADYEGTLLEADPKGTFGHTNFGSESAGRESVRLDTSAPFCIVDLIDLGSATSRSAARVCGTQFKNGGGILAMGGARGSATLTDVTIANSAEGDVLIEPGSGFVIIRPSPASTGPCRRTG